MPQGLQVWDEKGVITLDTNTNTGTLVGKVELKGPNKSVNVVSDAFTQGTPFYIVTPIARPINNAVKVVFNGNNATVSINNVDDDITVYLGVI